MKVVHLIGGGDVGGAKAHVLSLVKALSAHIDVKLICLRPGPFAEEAREMGIDVEVVKSHNILSDIKRVAGIIRAGSYDIIHSHGAKANMFSLAVRKIIKLPSVTTIHSDYKLDYMHSRLKRLTIGNINAYALRSMDYYIAISVKFKEMLINRGFKPSDMFILYNGMDFSLPKTNSTREAFIRKYKLPVCEDDILVGILARLEPVKSIDTLIKAAKLVNEKNKNIKFIIGGDGECRDSLLKLTASLELGSCVFFPGWVKDQDEFNNAIDISVLVSISESFPYSILEGIKYKRATISSRVGGIPDLIDDGINGCLFEPRDHEKLAELLLDLASDEAKRNAMGEKILEKALANFSLDSMCNTQLGIYEGIMKNEAARKDSKKDYDIIISGYYGFQNIGDDAMLMSIVNDLSCLRPDVRMLILSKNAKKASMQYNTDSIGRNSLCRIYRTMKKAKCFIYGGGNLIQDDTSTKSLLFYLLMICIAKKNGLKVMFYANGIGPLNRKLNRFLTGKILNHVDVITLREENSYKELNSLQITKPKAIVTADPALTLSNTKIIPRDILMKNLGIETNGPFIGFSVRSYPGHSEMEPECYEAPIAALADHMYEKFGLKPVLIPMQHPVDLPVLERIAAKMKNKCFVVDKMLSVHETASLISHMELLVGMRLHALIFAAATSVPVVGLPYQPKIDAFLSYSGLPSAGDVLKLNYEKLEALTEDIWSNREEIKARMKINIQPLREKAMENAQIAASLLQ